MGRFFSRLSYSFGNEDWRTDQKALNIKPSDRVLCITASGDRPLHLLLSPCKELITIDANPIQTALLHLKTAAMQQLEYEKYLEFLGAKQGTNRLETLKSLLKTMPENSQNFWNKNKKMVEKGVLYQGFVERKLQKFLAPTIRFFRGKKIRKLFSFTDINAQSEFIKNEWDHYLWRKMFHVAFNPLFSKSIFKPILDDPGLYENIQTRSAGKHFYERMQNCLSKNLAKESILFSLILNGKVEEEAYPPYLTKTGTEQIKSNISSMKALDIDLISYLKSCEDNSLDCFSLSDVASYLSYADYLVMLKEIARVAKPGARFSIRQFLSMHPFPREYQSIFKQDIELQNNLKDMDRCFVYNYSAGVIDK